MGLSFKSTLQEEFGFTNTIVGDNVEFEVVGNDIRIKYFPKIYVCGSIATKVGYDLDKSKFTFEYSIIDQAEWDKYKNLMEKGLQDIADTIKREVKDIYGLNFTFSIEFDPTMAYSEYEADVSIRQEMPTELISNKRKAPNVTTMLGWHKSSTGVMTLSKENWSAVNSPLFMDIQFRELTAHEFGHVIGLGDAYKGDSSIPYIIIGEPIEPDDVNLYSNSLMRYQWGDDIEYKILANDVEMILFAWKTNKMQLYNKNRLSQAFYY